MNLTRFEDIKDGMPVFMPSGIQARLFLEDDNIIVQYPELYRDKYTKEDFQKLMDEGIMVFHDVTVPQQSVLMEKLTTKGYIREDLANVLNISEAYEQEDNKPGDVYTALKDKEENKEYVTPEFKNELLTCLTKICKEYPIVKVRQQALTFIDELGLQEYYDVKAVKDFINKYTDLLNAHVNESLKEELQYGVEYRDMHTGIHQLLITDTKEKAEEILGLLNKLENPEPTEDENEQADNAYFTWDIINQLANDCIEVDYHETEEGDGNYNGIYIINYNEIKPDIYESLNEEDDKFNYMMLDRLKQDCEYFLGFGNRNEKQLWAGNVKDQIAEMRKIYDKLPEKPEWISLEDIDNYEKQMLSKDESLNEVKEITRDEWNKTPKDYKMIKDGKPYLVYLDNETHATVLGPCKIIDESLNEEQGPYYGSEALGNIAIEIENGNKQGVEPTEFGNWVLHTSIDEKWEQLTEDAKLFILEKIAMPVADGHVSYDDLELYISNASSLTREDIISMGIFDEEQIDSMLNGKEEMFLLSYELQFDGDIHVGESFKQKDKKKKKQKIEDSMNEDEGAGVYVKDKEGNITGPYLDNESAQDYIKQMVEQGKKEEDFEITTDNGENEMQETILVQEAFKVYNTAYGEVKEQGTFNNWNEVQDYLDQEWGKYNVEMVKENPTFGSQLDKENFMGNYNVEIIEVPVTLDQPAIQLVEPETVEIEGADSNKGEKSMLSQEEKPELEQPEITVCPKCGKNPCECNSGEPIEEPKEQIEEPQEEQIEEDLVELGSVLKDETQDLIDPATEVLDDICNDCEDECACEPCPNCGNIPCECEQEIIDNPEEAIEKVDDVEEIIDDIEDYIKTLLDADDGEVEMEVIEPVQEMCMEGPKSPEDVKKEKEEEEEKNEDFQDNMGMLTDVNDMDLPDALADTIDTKEDGSLYKISDLAKELAELKTTFAKEIEDIKNDIKSALQDVKQDIKQEVNNVETKVQDTKTAVDDLTVEEEEPVEEEPEVEEEPVEEEPTDDEPIEDEEELEESVNPIAEAIEKTLTDKMSKTTFYNKLNENYGYDCLALDHVALKSMVEGYIKANKLDKYIIDESMESEKDKEIKFLKNKYLRKGKYENLEDAKKKIDQYTSQNKSSEDIKNAITLLSDNDQERDEATDYAVEKMKESLLQTSKTSKLLNLSAGQGIGYKK